MTIIVTGTDTDIGKTVFAAGLTAALGARYWKPVQAGLADGSDAASGSAAAHASDSAAMDVGEDAAMPMRPPTPLSAGDSGDEAGFLSDE